MRPENLALNEKIKTYLSYNPETGELTWLKSPSFSVIAGTVTKGGVDDSGYRRIRFLRNKCRVHRLACFLMLGYWPEEVDHIDMDKTNNVWSNLRIATRSQNQANRRKLKSNASGYKGVCWHKRSQMWRAQIKHKGKVLWLGQFNEPEAAYTVYCEAVKKYFGEFGRVA